MATRLPFIFALGQTAMFPFIIGNKNDSSWSLWTWVVNGGAKTGHAEMLERDK